MRVSVGKYFRRSSYVELGQRRKRPSQISPAEARACQYVWLSAVEPAVRLLCVDSLDKPTWSTQFPTPRAGALGYEQINRLLSRNRGRRLAVSEDVGARRMRTLPEVTPVSRDRTGHNPSSMSTVDDGLRTTG